MLTAIGTALQVLEGAGFERLPSPLTVSGLTFQFDAVVRGTGPSHDLILLSGGSTDTDRLVRLVSGLARTLDQVNSSLPVSLVLIGCVLDRATADALERHARVLRVENPEPTEEEVRGAVAVLLPLELPSARRRGEDPLTEVVQLLGLSRSDEHQAFIDSAKAGPDAVKHDLRRYIDGAVQERPEASTRD